MGSSKPCIINTQSLQTIELTPTQFLESCKGVVKVQSLRLWKT